MGSCFSCEDDDDRPRNIQHRQYPPTLSSLPSRGAAAPTLRASPLIGFNSTRNDSYRPTEVYVRRIVPPPRPVVPVIRRPTPSVSSTRSTVVPKPIEFKPKPGALYGEYKCRCGYFWVSRLSWRDRYQQCKRCKVQVRPRNQRELRPSDFTSRDKFDESLAHPQELCEMCKQLGSYCGRYK